MLPPDSHVHSQWSRDALGGSMEATCARAAEIGVPALAFTEHADFTPWTIPASTELPAAWHPLVSNDILTAPALDLDGYLESLEHCRDRFPDLRILSGVELSEPHWHIALVEELFKTADFNLVISSVHSMRTDSCLGEISLAYEARPADEVVRELPRRDPAHDRAVRRVRGTRAPRLPAPVLARRWQAL